MEFISQDDMNQLDWEMSVILVVCALGSLIITLKLLFDLLQARS